MLTTILIYSGLFIVSIAVLLKGSDWFVDAAERLGLSLGVSPFIIGVTIVAFGTSLPELATSIAAVLGGDSEIVVGNVVGSNIANILLVLGLTAIVSKEIKLEFSMLNIDLPLLVISSLLLWFMLMDGHFSLFEAVLFLISLVIFLINSFKVERGVDEDDRPKTSIKDVGILLGAGVLIFVGAHYTIVAIKKLSLLVGVSKEVIALSMVALGTSLPEVAVSITAARKGKSAIAVGNVLGSNLFNTYGVMSIASFFGTLSFPPDVLSYSLPVMVAVTILFMLISISLRISRWEGAMLVLFYVYYLSQLF